MPQIKGRSNPAATNSSMTEIKAFYLKELEPWPDLEVPAIFGQHVNAEISSQIAEATQLLESIVSLQPKEDNIGGDSRESILINLINTILPRVPENIN